MTDSADLSSLIGRLAAARVVCVGDLMLDRFIEGAVERISPEGPIPVFAVRRETAMLGGAGNVLRNLAALGAAADLAAAIGADAAGDEVARLLGEAARTRPRLVRVPGRQTTIKTRFVAGSQQLLRVDRETVSALGGESRAALIAEVEAALRDCSVLVLSDYGKGVLAEDVTPALIAAAARAGRTVVVDPKGRDYARYRGAGVLTPNRRELAEATGMPTDCDEAVVAAGRRIIAETGIGAVLATRSEQGMTLVTETEAHHLPARAREVFDVSGAGDTVVAALAAALAVGAPLVAAARLANAAAGVVVGKVGTAVAWPSEILSALYEHALMDAEAKVMTLPAAVDRVAAWRRQGQRIAFTNGCFDLLHPGHISLLQQARSAADRLVVGLNSDDSVRRLKGAGRPVQAEAGRAAVLASLAAVDLVIVFGEDTPLALIEALRPDVLVKGADYTLDRVVGAAQVQSWGGSILLAELVPGHSTTATVRRLRP